MASSLTLLMFFATVEWYLEYTSHGSSLARRKSALCMGGSPVCATASDRCVAGNARHLVLPKYSPPLLGRARHVPRTVWSDVWNSNSESKPRRVQLCFLPN